MDSDKKKETNDEPSEKKKGCSIIYHFSTNLISIFFSPSNPALTSFAGISIHPSKALLEKRECETRQEKEKILGLKTVGH